MSHEEYGYQTGYIDYRDPPRGGTLSEQRAYWTGFTKGYLDAYGVYPDTPFAPRRF